MKLLLRRTLILNNFKQLLPKRILKPIVVVQVTSNGKKFTGVFIFNACFKFHENLFLKQHIYITNTKIKQMKKALLTFAISTASILTYAQTWTLDKAHAKLRFTVTHLMVSDVDGLFKSFDVKITSSKDDFTDAVIELTADINSINTENDYRDNDLKSEKFFDAAKFPTLSFKSTSIQKIDTKNYKLSGNLTMHGVTKPIVLDAILNGTVVNPMSKKTVAGFKIKGLVNRTDFGIAPSFPTAVVSDEVAITANIEIDKN